MQRLSDGTTHPQPQRAELPLLTMEGTLKGMTFQAAPVSKPLGSVKRMCSSGHRVVFDEGPSYILDLATGEVNWRRGEVGHYILDV